MFAKNHCLKDEKSISCCDYNSVTLVWYALKMRPNVSGDLSVRVIVLLVLILQGTRAFNSTVESELYASLLTAYNKGVRPAGVVEASIMFNLITINELIIRAQTFSVSGWFVMSWNDPRLYWDVANPLYTDVNFMFFTQKEIWRPTVVVENSIDDLSVIDDDNVPLRVFSNGKVVWNPPGIYVTNCDIDITYYPFDTQTCYISLKSVGYNIRELNLTLLDSGLKSSSFEVNGEWTLLSTTATRTESTDVTDAEVYATLQFSVTVQRRTKYYGLNILLPVLTLAVLSALVFLLPIESGEKMGYSLTVLLSISVFLTLIADQIPTTSKSIAILTIYISILIILNGLSVVLTLMTLDIYFRNDKEPVPHWLQKLTKYVMSPLACWGLCSKKKKKKIFETVRPLSKKIHRPSTETETETDDTEDDEHQFSWVEIAKVFDAFCLRIYVLLFIVITVVCFMMIFY
ncbi:neuronal acetylcholine receptor subunit alpha-7-like isoform X2 [Gigantopelta aegis]|uniref:neuronal acetylcholine receptor subunit alpha-7-like isoform X2 n=1 Tax=Gigantopelta aegis TaxID=1735272 RepID=UPI001B88B7EB|nr:neuronal acetylcholine receptor subunit alpha-7-like isoform X2 [Gigantopelta aegis]